MSKRKVLILCTGNSCRSHMPEGILRHAADDLLRFTARDRLRLDTCIQMRLRR